MQSLRITIRLRTPMVESRSPLQLDALLAALRVSRAMKQHGEQINPRDYHHDLPLERFTSPSGQWVFKASGFTLHRDAPSFTWMHTGRIDLATAAEHRASGWLSLRAAKPVLGGGPFKTSLYSLNLAWGELVADCVGDKDEIESLLAECRQVGGRRGTGFGVVKDFTVERIPEAECKWMNRAMPEDAEGLAESHALTVGGLHPPYWDKQLHRPVRVPLVG